MSIKNFTLALIVSTLTGAAAQAAPTCTYILDNEAYWDRADGVLIVDGKSYRCTTVQIGDDQRTLCKKKGASARNYSFYVYFDGAEGDFWATKSLAHDVEPLCHGIAVTKK